MNKRCYSFARFLHAGVLIALLATTAGAGNWPRFRGPDGQGISDDTAIPSAITSDHYRWRTELPGGGQSSPVIWGNRIYLTCSREEGKRALVCLDAADGNVLWTYEDRFEPHRNHKDNTFVSSTPAVDAERVYLWWTDGDSVRAAAVDQQGVEVWRRNLGPFSTRFGSAVSPVLAGGVLVLAKEDESDEAFVAGLDPTTGRTVWTLPRTTGKGSYSTPTLREAADGAREVICTSSAHGITAVDPTTGEVRWAFEGGFKERCVGSATVLGDFVLASAGGGGGGKEAYAVQAGSPPRLLYELNKDLPYVPTPVGRDGRFFMWSDRGRVTCVQAERGDVLWSEEVSGRTYASPLWIGGRVYGIDRAGLMVVVEAGDAFKELGRHQFEKGTDATPAVADGRLYVRLDDLLICVGGNPEASER